MRSKLLTFKNCKHKAVWFKRITPTDIAIKPYYDFGVTFKLGFVRGDNRKEFNIPNLRTIDTKFTIFTFQDLDFRAGDKVRFDNKDYFVEDVNYSYYESTQNQLIKQYFMTIK